MLFRARISVTTADEVSSYGISIFITSFNAGMPEWLSKEINIVYYKTLVLFQTAVYFEPNASGEHAHAHDYSRVSIAFPTPWLVDVRGRDRLDGLCIC
jgi:hypothetical protein